MNKPKFNVGDIVTVLPKFIFYIESKCWDIELIKLVGSEGKIIRIYDPAYENEPPHTDENNQVIYHNYKYFLVSNNKLYFFLAYEDCLELLNTKKEEPRIRWYKNGKLMNYN